MSKLSFDNVVTRAGIETDKPAAAPAQAPAQPEKPSEGKLSFSSSVSQPVVQPAQTKPEPEATLLPNFRETKIVGSKDPIRTEPVLQENLAQPEPVVRSEIEKPDDAAQVEKAFDSIRNDAAADVKQPARVKKERPPREPFVWPAMSKKIVLTAVAAAVLLGGGYGGYRMYINHRNAAFMEYYAKEGLPQKRVVTEEEEFTTTAKPSVPVTPAPVATPTAQVPVTPAPAPAAVPTPTPAPVATAPVVPAPPVQPVQQPQAFAMPPHIALPPPVNQAQTQSAREVMMPPPPPAPGSKITRDNVPGFTQPAHRSRAVAQSTPAKPVQAAKVAPVDAAAARAQAEADYTQKMRDEQEAALRATPPAVNSATADALAKQEARLKEVERLAREANQRAREAELKASLNRPPVDPCAGLPDRSLAQVECYASHRR